MKLKIFISILTLVVGLLPFAADAVTLNKNFFMAGEPIVFRHIDCTAPNANSVDLYDLTTGINLGGFPCLGNDGDLIPVVDDDVVFPVVGHQYSLFEVTINGICEGGDTYLQCRARPEFVDEFKFSVTSQIFKDTSLAAPVGVTKLADAPQNSAVVAPNTVVTDQEEQIRVLRIKILELQIKILQLRLQLFLQ